MWARSHASGLIRGECCASRSASDRGAVRSKVRSRVSASPSMTASVSATPTVTESTLPSRVGGLAPHFEAVHMSHYEPGAGMDDLGAELPLEVVRRQVPLVHAVARSVVEAALLPRLGRNAVVQRGVDHDELGRHPAGLMEESCALCAGQMAVEMAGQDAI